MWQDRTMSLDGINIDDESLLYGQEMDALE